jgi:hypothetical protein
VLEDEEIRLALAGQPDEGVVVILDYAVDLFTVQHFHAHGRRVLDQLLEVLGFLKRGFRGASRFALLCRNRFS